MSNTYEEKKEFVRAYIRSLNAIEESMEPFKEQKRDLRKEFRDNMWLTTEEIRAAVKAYRLYKGGFDLEEIIDHFNTISGNQ